MQAAIFRDTLTNNYPKSVKSVVKKNKLAARRKKRAANRYGKNTILPDSNSNRHCRFLLPL
jgi:hypothetical protein